MGIADERCLRFVQNKLGGSVKVRSGVKALRWRLHNKPAMLKLVQGINGHIRHSARLMQLHRVCLCLGIQPLGPMPLTRANAWFAGFFDADGTITYSLKGPSLVPQLTISVTNKKLVDVQPFKDIFGGNIYFDQAQNGYYKWSVQSQSDILMMLDYFKLCPSRSAKANRLHLVRMYYKLKDLKAYKPISAFHSAWCKFNAKWHGT